MEKNTGHPQLLYIEALYYIHYRYDSIGKVTLNKIITRFPRTIMSAKAKNMLRVLNERERIENYLRNLHVPRMTEDSIARVANAAAQPKITDSANAKAKAMNAQNTGRDSSQISIKKPDALQLKAQALFVSPYIMVARQTPVRRAGDVECGSGICNRIKKCIRPV